MSSKTVCLYRIYTCNDKSLTRSRTTPICMQVRRLFGTLQWCSEHNNNNNNFKESEVMVAYKFTFEISNTQMELLLSLNNNCVANTRQNMTFGLIL